MKIAYVLDDSLDRPDGVQQAILTIGEWMRKRGHEVHYLVATTERTDIDGIHPLARKLSVRFNGNKMGTTLPTSYAKLHRFLRLQQYDVLHVQMPYSPFFAGRLINAAPETTKVVGTFHILPYGPASVYGTRLLSLTLKRSLKRFDHFISVSKPAADFAKKTMKFDSEVVPNPVDTKRFTKARIDHQAANKKRIVFLGRLVERKGVLHLLEAYKLAIKLRPGLIEDSELLIGGKGKLLARAQKLAAALPAKANVQFLGFVDEKDKPKLLAEADLAVFPSTSGESFGIVLVEAMAAGSCMILAGDNPGYRSVLAVKPKLLVNAANHELFAKRIIELLDDNAENSKLSIWLRDQADQYDIDNVGARLEEIYES